MEDEQSIRLFAFLGIISLVVIWEFYSPKRQLTQARNKRWLHHITLITLNVLIVRLILPVSAVWVAAKSSDESWGLLNIVPIDANISIILAIIALDCIVYWQHRLFHALPILWRLHQVHHADRDIDVSTGLRFHPIEIVLSMLIKFAAIILLGVPVIAVVLFEVILNGMAMFNHGNISLPSSLDKYLRYFIVTPDMHRVHHSVLKHETNSNYGFNISLWDRLFQSYHAQPDAGHHKMIIGLAQYQQQPTYPLLLMLRLPFVGNGGQYTQKDMKLGEKEGRDEHE